MASDAQERVVWVCETVENTM